MVKATVALTRDARQVSSLLASREIAGLVADLEATRWTGLPGKPSAPGLGAHLRHPRVGDAEQCGDISHRQRRGQRSHRPPDGLSGGTFGLLRLCARPANCRHRR